MLALTQAEINYQNHLKEVAKSGIDHEVAFVGAGLGGGFKNTAELKVMKYAEAMQSDRVGWTKAVEEEYQRMVSNKVWVPVNIVDVPKGAKVLTSTWAMKKKSNGRLRARINGRGYEQIDGIHYESNDIHAPVTNDTTVRVVMVLALMAGWLGLIADVQGAFLKGELDYKGNERMYLKVPQGFECKYSNGVVLWLLKALYGTKQAAMAFWKELLKCMRHLGFERSGADPCLYFKWTVTGLVVWLSWIDDCMVWGKAEQANKEKDGFVDRFDCDDIGEVKEYVGCKIDRDVKDNVFKFTQPVMIQSFRDEFELGKECAKTPVTPADPGTVLVKAEDKDKVGQIRQTYYRSGVGKLLHMARWSRPDVQNAVRDVSRHGSAPVEAHVKAMHRILEFVERTKDRGWKLKPDRRLNGYDRTIKFKIKGNSNLDFANCPETRRGVSGWVVSLKAASVAVKSIMQKIVVLSVTDAELVAAVLCV